MGQRGKIFQVDGDTLFFFKNFSECANEAQNVCERSEQNASAKLKGAKRPSSLAGLA